MPCFYTASSDTEEGPSMVPIESAITSSTTNEPLSEPMTLPSSTEQFDLSAVEDSFRFVLHAFQALFKARPFAQPPLLNTTRRFHKLWQNGSPLNVDCSLNSDHLLERWTFEWSSVHLLQQDRGYESIAVLPLSDMLMKSETQLRTMLQMGGGVDPLPLDQFLSSNSLQENLDQLAAFVYSSTGSSVSTVLRLSTDSEDSTLTRPLSFADGACVKQRRIFLVSQNEGEEGGLSIQIAFDARALEPKDFLSSPPDLEQAAAHVGQEFQSEILTALHQNGVPSPLSEDPMTLYPTLTDVPLASIEDEVHRNRLHYNTSPRPSPTLHQKTMAVAQLKLHRMKLHKSNTQAPSVSTVVSSDLDDNSDFCPLPSSSIDIRLPSQSRAMPEASLCLSPPSFNNGPCSRLVDHVNRVIHRSISSSSSSASSVTSNVSISTADSAPLMDAPSGTKTTDDRTNTSPPVSKAEPIRPLLKTMQPNLDSTTTSEPYKSESTPPKLLGPSISVPVWSPVLSSPLAVSHHTPTAEEEHDETASQSTLSPTYLEQQPENDSATRQQQQEQIRLYQTAKHSGRRRESVTEMHGSLVGNYEESILTGRLSTPPSRPIQFLCELGVLATAKTKPSLRCPPHVTIPFSAYFYEWRDQPSTLASPHDKGALPVVSPSPSATPSALISSPTDPHPPAFPLATASPVAWAARESTSTPYVGNVDLEWGLSATNQFGYAPTDNPNQPLPKHRSPLDPPGAYRVPAKGQVQLLIKNPSKNVVKIFLVPYDLRSMHVWHRTVIRQKSYSTSPSTEKETADEEEAQVSAPGALRFAVHLQFLCLPSPTSATQSSPSTCETKRYYLYKSIRVVFSHRLPDGQERLRMVTEQLCSSSCSIQTQRERSSE